MSGRTKAGGKKAPAAQAEHPVESCDCGCCCGCCCPTGINAVFTEIGPRPKTVLTRLSTTDSEKVEGLVSLGVFRSTSEATAFFLHEGLSARNDLLKKAGPLARKMQAIRRTAGSLTGRAA